MMMKNKTITLMCLLAAGILAVASCKKKEDNSVHARLAGKWKVNQTAVDSNNNGVMDAAEVQTRQEASYSTFISDGTGKDEDGGGVTGTFTWTLSNNDENVTLKYLSGSSTGAQFTLHITALTATDLNVYENDSFFIHKVWVMLKKQ